MPFKSSLIDLKLHFHLILNIIAIDLTIFLQSYSFNYYLIKQDFFVIMMKNFCKQYCPELVHLNHMFTRCGSYSHFAVYFLVMLSQYWSIPEVQNTEMISPTPISPTENIN